MLFALGTPKTLWNAPLRFDGCARRFNRISRREYTSVVNDILHANCLAQRNLRNVYPEVAAYALQHPGVAERQRILKMLSKISVEQIAPARFPAVKSNYRLV
jgi:hypothetical protein